MQRIIINVIHWDKKNLGKGVIYDFKYFSSNRIGSSSTTVVFYILDNKGVKYEDGGDSDNDEYGFSVGDTVVFRKLYNGNNARMIIRNGKQVRDYYGFLDYVSPLFVILIILGYIYIPKISKREKYKKASFTDYENINTKKRKR